MQQHNLDAATRHHVTGRMRRIDTRDAAVAFSRRSRSFFVVRRGTIIFFGIHFAKNRSRGPHDRPHAGRSYHRSWLISWYNICLSVPRVRREKKQLQYRDVTTATTIIMIIITVVIRHYRYCNSCEVRRGRKKRTYGSAAARVTAGVPRAPRFHNVYNANIINANNNIMRAHLVFKKHYSAARNTSEIGFARYPIMLIIRDVRSY